MIVLEIVGVLLKIIGILFLLLVLLLFLLLLVPLRYQAKLQRDIENSIKVQAEASYLLRMVRLQIFFQDKKLSYCLKALCFTIFSSNKPRKRRKKKVSADAEIPPENKEAEGSGGSEPEAKESGARTVEGETGAEAGNNSETKAAARAEEDTTETNVDGKAEIEAKAESTAKAKTEENETGTEAGNSSDEAKAVEREEETKAGSEDKTAESEFEEFEKRNIFEKLQDKFQQKIDAVWQKFRSLADKIKTAVNRICELIQKALSIFSDGKDKLGLIQEFFKDETNKNGIKYAGKTIFKLLKHVLPYKMEGEVVFGTGDPYSMGQILSVLGIFYAAYAKRLKVEADFETERFRLEGRISLKGRIRLGSVLLLMIRLWFKGKLKKVLTNVKVLKEELVKPSIINKKSAECEN